MYPQGGVSQHVFADLRVEGVKSRFVFLWEWLFETGRANASMSVCIRPAGYKENGPACPAIVHGRVDIGMEIRSEWYGGRRRARHSWMAGRKPMCSALVTGRVDAGVPAHFES